MTESADLAPIREAVRALCADFPGEYWRALDRERAYPEKFVAALTKAGFLAALIPEEYGGSGLTMTAAAAIMEEIQASGCNGAACHAQMYTMGTLLRHGSAEQKKRYLPGIARGDLRLQAFGVTEPTSGTDTLSLRTTAVRDGNDGYVVNGQKIWTSRAEHSDLMLLLARTTPRDQVKKRTDGLSVFLVDMREVKGNGLTIRPIRTMMNHATTEVFFENMRVPAENLIGEEGEGFRYILSGMNAERILIAAECIGDAKWFIAESHGLCRRARGVRPADRPEPGRPVSDRARLHQHARRRTDGARSGRALRSRQGLRRRSEHGQASCRRSVVGGGRHVRANPWRLRLRRRIRYRAQIPRDPALYGGADLDQSGAVLHRRARPGTAEVVLSKALPLSGLLVVSLEQAVAAPMCTCRLADAGARVIKIERPEGDFARGYDDLVHGECSYFVWLNRGKESVVLDLGKPEDKALLAAMLARADMFVQNLKPGAVAKLGFPIAKLRREHPRLICCSISGFGESGPHAKRKAYDMLIQAESGLASITGTAEPSRVGVSVVDIASGMNAYEAILEALIARERTGEGAELSISMFDAMADWMTVPLLQQEAGAPPQRIGLAHTSISPYGAFRSRDGVDILISIQSDREWRVLAEKVLGDAALAADPAFATNVERVKRRAETDGRVAKVFGALDADALEEKLAAADIAFARVNSPADLARHPHLRRITIGTPSGPVSYPAPAERSAAASRHYGPVPALGEHTDKVRAEFMAATIDAK